MDNDDEFDVDPAIAAAMGFSGFGAAPKKRKFHRDDGFVDPAIATSSSSTGANSIPTGPRRTATVPQTENTRAEDAVAAPVVDANLSGNESREPSLQALASGIQNAAGDMVIFKPSFLEDPWERLLSSKT